MLSKKEVLTLLIASAVVAFTIAFDDKQPTFIVSLWLANYFLTLLLTLVAFLIFMLASKYAAAKARSSLTLELWSLRRTGLSLGAKAKTPFYLGAIIPLMLAVLSGGKLPFGAATQYRLETKPAHRIGKENMLLSEFEAAKIATFGPLILTFCAIILNFSASSLAARLSRIMLIIAVTNMLPLPNLNGMKAFFSSRLWYVFCAAMIAITIPLISVVNPAVLIPLVIIFGLVIVVLYYNYAFIKAK